MAQATSGEVTLDFQRAQRIGLDEAIYCEGKAPEHLTEILATARANGHGLLLTRLAPDQRAKLSADDAAQLDYEGLSRTAYFGSPPEVRASGRVAVVFAGTSDAGVAREVVRTLRWSGELATVVGDVGAAGLWRLTDKLEILRAHRVLVVVAGMDGALPTVVGGLLPCAIVAVPTSVGYGVAKGGHAALNAILASCAPGLSTVNIDNGYGAACAALRILRAQAGD